MKLYQKSTLLSLSLTLVVSCGGSGGGGGGSSSSSNENSITSRDIALGSQILADYPSSLDLFSACLSDAERNYSQIINESQVELVGACCSTLENRVLKDDYRNVYYDHIFPDSITESMIEDDDNPLWDITINQNEPRFGLDAYDNALASSPATNGKVSYRNFFSQVIQHSENQNYGVEKYTPEQKLTTLSNTIDLLGHSTFLAYACEQQKEAIESIFPSACFSSKEKVLSLIDPFLENGCTAVDLSTIQTIALNDMSKQTYIACIKNKYSAYADFFSNKTMSSCCAQQGGTFNALGYPNPNQSELVPVPVKPSQNYGGCAMDDGACMANVFSDAFYSDSGLINEDDFSSELVQNMLVDMCTSNETMQN